MEKEIFALTDPISIITGKDKNSLTRNDLIKVMIEKKIERITFHYTGIDGKIKELRIPISNRKQAELILAEGERCDGSSIFKGMVDVGKSDLYVVPVYKTAFLNPFDPTSLDLTCRFLDRNGNLADFAPDNILAKAHNNFKNKTGFDIYSLGELEFYLIGNFENQTYPMPKQRGYHQSAPFVKTDHIVNEMLHHMAKITGNIKYAHNEVGYIDKVESDFAELKGKSAEQVEIEFLLTPIEETADVMVLASWLVRNVAYKHGFVATFFPKIDTEHAGNGLHFHNALYKNGKNVMTKQDGTLADEAIQFIGGLCQYAPSLTAFGNMVSSSYLRLVPNHEAPTKVCWSESNRSSLIRVPLAWTSKKDLAMQLNPQEPNPYNYQESRQTVELRSPDGSANVHLLLAGITMAADWGLGNKEESTELAKNSYVSENIHANPAFNELGDLATSCVESSEILLSNKHLYERENIFPHRVIEQVANTLQNENDRNLNKRIMALPKEEQSYESRRIMHRNLHKH